MSFPATGFHLNQSSTHDQDHIVCEIYWPSPSNHYDAERACCLIVCPSGKYDHVVSAGESTSFWGLHRLSSVLVGCITMDSILRKLQELTKEAERAHQELKEKEATQREREAFQRETPEFQSPSRKRARRDHRSGGSPKVVTYNLPTDPATVKVLSNFLNFDPTFIMTSYATSDKKHWKSMTEIVTKSHQ